eukprot:scaffold3801_cov124-Isochrysis_galbana.AAC.4
MSLWPCRLPPGHPPLVLTPPVPGTVAGGAGQGREGRQLLPAPSPSPHLALTITHVSEPPDSP